MLMIEELRKTNSRSLKEAILKRHMRLDEDNVKVLQYTYDPEKRYGMKMPIELFDFGVTGNPSDQMFGLLDDILNRKIYGNEAKDAVHNFANANGNLIYHIVNKDLRCNISSAVINRARKGTIPKFKVQLAKEVPASEVRMPVYAEIKYDGVRIVIVKQNGKVSFYTRNGKRPSFPSIARLFDAVDFDFVLDTEVVLAGGKSDLRTSVSGMVNSSMHGGRVNESILQFYVFDAMFPGEFFSQSCQTTYNTRLEFARHITRNVPSNQITMGKQRLVQTVDEVNEYYSELVAQGYEGLILKHPNHKYTFKRSKDWVKMKEIRTADLECVAILEGTGKYRGLIGALMCKGKVEGFDVTVAVGSGLSDADRSVTNYVGKTIEVKYNSLIRDSASGDWSLFLPRFVQVRIDK